jgi:hypothetical protein
MTTQFLRRRLEQLEKQMGTLNDAPVSIIRVTFVDPTDRHIVDEFDVRIPPYAAVPERNGGQP